MRNRLLYLLLAACLTGASFALTVGPASADLFSVTYRDADNQLVTVTVDAPDSASARAQAGGEVESVTRIGGSKPAPASEASSDATTSAAPDSKSSSTTTTDQPGADDNAGSVEKSLLSDPATAEKARPKAERRRRSATKRGPSAQRRRSAGGGGGGGGGGAPSPMRRPSGAPARSNPTFVDALPGPARSSGVPNFVIRKFRVPPFLLPIYQAAGIQYGIRWEVLAAVNEIETDYGRNLNVSSAGALGWMQFMPATWKMYGTDGNQDGEADPFNPVDAIFAAARYLKAAGGDDNIRKGLFAYNRADWYVDSVMMRARLIAGVPSDVVGSLTGLTEGRFPVAARARYADDLAERDAKKTVRPGRNAARLVGGQDSRRSIDIFAKRGAPAVAVNDGIIKKIGRSKAGDRYVVLQDVYGNRYTYSGLDSVSRYYPVPKDEGRVTVDEDTPGKDPRPSAAASAGRQRSGGGAAGTRPAAAGRPAPAAPKVIVKERLFAHPMRPNARRAGGAAQLDQGGTSVAAGSTGLKGFTSFENYFSRPIGLDAADMRLKPMRVGARVIGGTIIGRIGKPDSRAAHLSFEIRPAGRGAPAIDPKPILDGWKLLEATAVYRASGRNALFGADGDSFSIGQVLLLPKPLLEKRVLSDERIDVYPCGGRDIRSGQIDRRVLATMAYLAEAGLRPAVTSLKCGHGTYTSSGNVSQHTSGNAVDIAKVNGVPIVGHQDRGSITEQTVKRLMQLQGTMHADQIISLLDLGGNTLAMSDHNDHIHVGFRPLFGDNRKQGAQALAVLRPGQWDDLLGRLRRIENPVVRVKKSKYSIPARKRRASGAHRGE